MSVKTNIMGCCIFEALHVQWGIQAFTELIQLDLCVFKKKKKVLLSNTPLCAISTHLTELHSVGVYRVGVS